MRYTTTHRTAHNILLPEVLRRGRLALLALLFTLVLAACGKPVPADKQAYVGTWESTTTSLLIDASGRVIYKHQPSPSVSKSLDAPIKAYEGNDFIAGVGPLTTRFVVSVPPHQVDGSWKMTVDGQELTRR
ncbi:hypothetical protein [uncultured Stenotrophomonas sp.]|uniref:hypothetical protein n=1 Tax=uncultured Stenotrophomonas sp. TaxID=165438 RepID=UPI0025EE027F|nr:hypothetical protein [uncultured Stenotrophomonas sp.]